MKLHNRCLRHAVKTDNVRIFVLGFSWSLPWIMTPIIIPAMRTIIGFGASSMQGTGDSAGGFFHRLTAKLSPLHPHLKFLNCGIGGHGTREMLLRTQAVTAISPREVIVLLGCNDLPRVGDNRPQARTTLEAYTTNLDQLLQQVRGQRNLFISSFAVCSRRTGVEPALFDTYMTHALQLARKHNYDIWDLYRETQNEVSRFWAKDGLHFNDAGHQLLADKVEPWITAGSSPAA